MATFQERLEEALTTRGLKPADLARLTGIGEGAISQYRKGAYKATQRNLEKIAQALNFSIPWLMGADVSADQISAQTTDEKPAPNGDELLDAELIHRLTSLTPDEMQKVDAFVQGLLANR